MEQLKVSAIIPAAGIGRRFSENCKKQFFTVHGKPVLHYTLKALKKAYGFHEYILGINPEDQVEAEDIVREAFGDTLTVHYTPGGKDRAGTVQNALQAAQGEYVLIHDAVRPFITREMVTGVIETSLKSGGAICALEARDTVKLASHGKIERTLDRSCIYMAHTPQVYERDKLLKAMAKSGLEGITLTDEAMAYEYGGYDVWIAPSTVDNIKITRYSDLPLVEFLITRYFGELPK